MKRWNLAHTNVYKRYFMLRSRFPFAAVTHFTATPVGNQICMETLKIRISNSFYAADTCYALIYNYETSEAGVHHVHGFMYRHHNTSLTDLFKQNNLVLLESQGGVKGWIKYILKDKGKTYVRTKAGVLLQQNYL